MTILTDMAANVYILTNRPDLVAETKSQLKKAAIKLHGKDFFYRDLAETTVALTVVDALNFRYSIDTSNASTFPRFRKVLQIRDYNSPLTGQELNYKIYSAADIIDDYNLERTNYAYQAGTAINLSATKALTQVKISYYQFPDVGDTTFSSWIANMSTAYLEEEAARNIFKMIGKDEEYQKYEGICNDNLESIIMTGISTL